MNATEYPRLTLYINGQWLDRQGRDASEVLDPATGQTLGLLPHASDDDVDAALHAAHAAFPAWRRTAPLERAAILRNAARLLRERVEQLSRIVTQELGKPLAESRVEVTKAAELFEWSAEESRRIYGRIIPAREPRTRQMVLPEPIGPVAAFSGWNAPAITPSRKIASALAAGCTVVIKPAEETPATALFLARVLHDSGLPAGVLNMVFGDPGRVSDRMLQSPLIRAVTFTGSTAIGTKVAQLAAAGLKRSVLELGGHAPVLVFGDVDPQAAATTLMQAKLRNAGQICTSPTRMLVHESVAARFAQSMAEQACQWRVGPGMENEVQMGPLANVRRLQAIQSMVEDGRQRGGKVLAGGQRIGDKGYFFQPTVMQTYDESWLAANVEPFGPLAIIRTFSTFDQAIAEANRLPFGLAAYVFTHDAGTITDATDAIESGTVCVNHCLHSLPETPFGGVKHSGLGKEGGAEGLMEFTQYKYVTQR
ncbi:MAG: NAD-dependent succinate-semialdehyde dehydrogenase [Burkholderiaceae bacterium]|jgi:succinate-semialdehyde dehydrogenase/glutarate-semialdehyde dehydrogenase|nr:NAD-dependent succinate-semialdehyde dehydrogenase [Burkholderiaceae bacterium]